MSWLEEFIRIVRNGLTVIGGATCILIGILYILALLGSEIEFIIGALYV
jgi:hypothetical protein